MYSQVPCCQPVWTLKSNYRPAIQKWEEGSWLHHELCVGQTSPQKSLIKQCLIHSDTWRTQAAPATLVCTGTLTFTMQNSHHWRAAQHYCLICTQGNHRGMATTNRQPSVTVSSTPEETTTLTRLEKDKHKLQTGLSNPRALLQSTPVPPQLNPSQSEWRVQTSLYHIVQCLLIQTTVQALTLWSLGRTDMQVKPESQEVAVMGSQLLHGPKERSAYSALPGVHTWVLPIARHGAPSGFRAVGVGQHGQGWRSDTPTWCQPQGWQVGSSPPHPRLSQAGAH